MQTLSSLLGATFTLLTAYGLGMLCLRGRKAPPEVTLALGAIAYSILIFLLLLVNAAYWWAFAGLGLLAIGICCKTAAWRRPCRPEAYTTLLFGTYGLWYLVNALAPEIAP